MSQQSTINHLLIDPATISVLLLLFVLGIGYAWFVRKLRRRNRNHGYTAFLVVVGNLIVVAGFATLAGIYAAMLLIACMAAAGVPMIVEYIDDHLAAISSNDSKLEL